MEQIILCISGKRGSGKSLLGSMLRPYGFQTVSLAYDLKKRCQADFGLSDEQVFGTDKESPTGYVRTDGSPLTARDIMIRMGVFYRSVDPLFWCKKVNTPPFAVIDDIRFLNEVNYFKQYRAKFIRIERLPELNIFKQAMDDLSETELDSFKDWDFVLDAENNKTPTDLARFASYIWAHLK